MPCSRTLLAVICLAPWTTVLAQIPDALRAAILARDSAITRVDAPAWDRLTWSTFTLVTADGSMVTKAERLAGFKTHKPMPAWSRSREVAIRYGDAYVVRFLANGEWFLEVWARENGQWKTAATQVTWAKK